MERQKTCNPVQHNILSSSLTMFPFQNRLFLFLIPGFHISKNMLISRQKQTGFWKIPLETNSSVSPRDVLLPCLRKLAFSCLFGLLWDSILNSPQLYTLQDYTYLVASMLSMYNLLHFIAQMFNTHHGNVQTENRNSPLAEHKGLINTDDSSHTGFCPC